MENPETWGEIEYAIHHAINEAVRDRQRGVIGLSMTARVANVVQPFLAAAEAQARKQAADQIAQRIDSPMSGCWLCAGQGGVALHDKWTAQRGKPLFTAHEIPTDDPHPVYPCPACEVAAAEARGRKQAADEIDAFLDQNEVTPTEEWDAANIADFIRSVRRVARAGSRRNRTPDDPQRLRPFAGEHDHQPEVRSCAGGSQADRARTGGCTVAGGAGHPRRRPGNGRGSRLWDELITKETKETDD